MIEWIQRRSMAGQLCIALAIAVVLVFASLVAVATHLAQRSQMNVAKEELGRQVKLLADMLVFYHGSLGTRAEEYAEMLLGDLGEPLYLNSQIAIRVGQHETPLLLAGDTPLNGNDYLVDSFAARTGGKADVFVRMGDAFINIASSSGAAGEALPARQPIAQALLAGDSYTVPLRQDGRELFLRYQPIKHRLDGVIGAVAVAVDFTTEFAELRRSITELIFADTARAFVVGRQGSASGILQIHPNPSREGQPLATLTAAPVAQAARRLLEEESGILQYHSTAGDQLLAYRAVPGWNWAIAAGGELSQFHAAGRTLGLWLTLTAAAAAILLLGLMFIFVRSQTRPLAELSDAVRRFGSGDLTVDFKADAQADGGNEVRALRRVLQRMAADHGSLLHQLAAAASQLRTMTAAVLATTQDAAEGAAAQQEDTDQVASGMAQMTQAVRDVAVNAAQAHTAAQNAAASARQGAAQVNQTVVAVERFVVDIEQVARSLDQIHLHSAAIGRIVELIQAVAAQTSLLALNAAIEAARAGSEGRGFAVVAGEIRQLAGRTAKATDEIQLMVEALQGSSKDAVAAMAHGQETGAAAARQAEAAGCILSEIDTAVARISELNGSIAAAAEEQAQATTLVSEGAARIRQVSVCTADGAQGNVQGCLELGQLAERLHDLVARFKLTDGTISGHASIGGQQREE